MSKRFNFKEVPEGYKLCFNGHCPKCSECIRYLAGQHLPDGMESGPCVYPNAVKHDVCGFFKQTRIIHAAWGFRNLYKGVEKQDANSLRARVTNYLGGPVSAYAYMHGDRLLIPEQQNRIKSFFEELGYHNELVFDGFTTIYDFTE